MSDDLVGEYNLDDEIQFGRHKGATIRELADTEISYVKWALDNVDRFELSEEAYEYCLERAENAGLL